MGVVNIIKRLDARRRIFISLKVFHTEGCVQLPNSLADEVDPEADIFILEKEKILPNFAPNDLMWHQTKATEILGIEYPILQGPFGGNLSSVGLVSAVADAGGLGGYGAYTLSPQEIVEVDRQIRAATSKPYNINLWVSDTDTADGTVSDKQFEQARALFKPYFDEVGLALPGKPPSFSSRFECHACSQANAVLGCGEVHYLIAGFHRKTRQRIDQPHCEGPDPPRKRLSAVPAAIAVHVVPEESGHRAGALGYGLILGRPDLAGTETYKGRRTDASHNRRNERIL